MKTNNKNKELAKANENKKPSLFSEETLSSLEMMELYGGEPPGINIGTCYEKCESGCNPSKDSSCPITTKIICVKEPNGCGCFDVDPNFVCTC